MRHNIMAVLMVTIMAVALPLIAQIMPLTPDNRPSGPTSSWLIDNVNPNVHLDVALDLKSGSIVWSREYYYQNHWDWNNGSVALPGHRPSHARGPSWGIFSHNIYEPTNGLTSWCGPFIGNRNLKFSLMTNLDHGPGRRYGVFIFLRY